MKRYRIAGLAVDMESFGRTEQQAEPYLVPREGAADLTIDCDAKQILELNPQLQTEEMAMYMGTIAAAPFKSTLTYEILLIVVIGGIGSITGSIIASFLYIFSSEWLLRGLDSGTFLGINAPDIFKNGFRMAVFSVIIMVIVLFFRKGIMGDKELPDLLNKRPKKQKKEVAGK